MDKLKQNLKRKNEKSPVTTQQETKSRKSILIGTLIATFLGISPYLFYLYEDVPSTQVWVTDWFTYDSKSWEDAQFAMWVFTNKLIPLTFLLIWFFTCRDWWYHVLIVPIAMYIYQGIGIFNDNLGFIDSFELIYLLPVMCLVIPSIYLVRAQMFNKLNTANKTLEELEAEFMLKPTTLWGKIKQYF